METTLLTQANFGRLELVQRKVRQPREYQGYPLHLPRRSDEQQKCIEDIGIYYQEPLLRHRKFVQPQA
jgi:hypothetical protein